MPSELEDDSPLGPEPVAFVGVAGEPVVPARGVEAMSVEVDGDLLLGAIDAFEGEVGTGVTLVALRCQTPAVHGADLVQTQIGAVVAALLQRGVAALSGPPTQGLEEACLQIGLDLSVETDLIGVADLLGVPGIGVGAQ